MLYKSLIAGASLLAAASTFAATQIYSVSGVMTDIRQGGAGIAYGTTFAATYTHDDSPQPGSLIEAGRILFQGGAFTISAGILNLAAIAPTELQVLDNWTSTVGGYNSDDGFFVSGFIYDSDPASFHLIQFDLWDFTGNTLNGLSVPSQEQFLQLSNNGRFWIRRFENGVETGVALGGIQTISAVPEPSSAALFLLGIAVALRLHHVNRTAA